MWDVFHLDPLDDNKVFRRKNRRFPHHSYNSNIQITIFSSYFNDLLPGHLRGEDDALYADITVYSQNNGTIQNPLIHYRGLAQNTTVAE